MRKRIVVLLVIAVCAIAATGSAQGAQTYVNNCDTSPVGRQIASAPRAWAYYCAVRSFPEFTDLVWTGWGAGTANATGNALVAHLCQNIEDGEVCRSPVPAVVRLSSPKLCFGPNGPARFYTRASVSWTIPQGTPWSDTFGPESDNYALTCASPNWSIPARWSERIGPVRSGGSPILVSDAERVFGPSRQRLRQYSCFTTWSKIGMRVFSPIGMAGITACDAYAPFWSVEISDKRWHLWNGIRVGSPVGAVRKKAIRRCLPRWECAPSRKAVAYVMAQRRSQCSRVIVPTVVASVERGRVVKIELGGNCD